MYLWLCLVLHQSWKPSEMTLPLMKTHLTQMKFLLQQTPYLGKKIQEEQKHRFVTLHGTVLCGSLYLSRSDVILLSGYLCWSSSTAYYAQCYGQRIVHVPLGVQSLNNVQVVNIMPHSHLCRVGKLLVLLAVFDIAPYIHK